ncbi:MAG: hypothetical protein K2X66_04130, partial [Cyanobacteria bacterium]|nr:hypothetical protein [Cyanobacteriota bacterium]
MKKEPETIIKPVPEIGEMWRSSGFSLRYMNDASYEVDICSPDPWVSFQFKTYEDSLVANPHKTIHQGTIFKNETHFWGRHTPVFAKNPNPYEQVLVIFNENLMTREDGKP